MCKVWLLPEVFDQSKAIHSRHVQIGDDHIVRLAPHHTQSLDPIPGQVYFVTVSFYNALLYLPRIERIVHHQDRPALPPIPAFVPNRLQPRHVLHGIDHAWNVEHHGDLIVPKNAHTGNAGRLAHVRRNRFEKNIPLVDYGIDYQGDVLVIGANHEHREPLLPIRAGILQAEGSIQPGDRYHLVFQRNRLSVDDLDDIAMPARNRLRNVSDGNGKGKTATLDQHRPYCRQRHRQLQGKATARPLLSLNRHRPFELLDRTPDHIHSHAPAGDIGDNWGRGESRQKDEIGDLSLRNPLELFPIDQTFGQRFLLDRLQVDAPSIVFDDYGDMIPLL